LRLRSGRSSPPKSREMFKQFLVEEANCSEIADSGILHLTDISEEHAVKIVGEWWTALFTAWRAWKQHKANEANPDVAPSPQGEAPDLTDPTKPVDDDRPDFMKK